MWPKLREDIHIESTGYEQDGTPSWVIYDPLRRLYFRIGWVEYEILIRWKLQSFKKISDSINTETTLRVDEAFIEKLLNYLKNNNLLQITIDKDLADLIERSSYKKNILKTILQRYIAFYIPITRPNKLLNATFPLIKKIFFHKFFVYLLISLFLVSIYLISREWDHFLYSFDYFFNISNVIYLLIGISIVKIVHELGHAYAAKYYGCHIASMGIAFLVIWPLLYTDTTDSWKLKNHNHRIMIQAAGVIAELSLAVIATFIWAISEDGVFRSTIFYIASISWISTILVNCNPLIRFDGYHVFSDILKVDNLQQRGFLLGSWKLKEWLLGLGEEQPVQCPDSTRTYLLIYTYLTWVYRFFLFIGIAIVIYYMFFKALGVFLMLVEIFYLIIMPIFKEAAIYVLSIKDRGGMTKRATISLSILIILTLILVIPWKSSISMPAVLEFAKEESIYVPHSSRIDKLYVKRGDIVQKDQILATLYSNEITNKLLSLTEEIKKIESRIESEVSLGKKLSFEQASNELLLNKINELESMKKEQNKLTIKAPISGEIISIVKDIKENSWLKKDDFLLSIAKPNKWSIISYINEGDIKRIHVGGDAKFFAYSEDLNPINAKVVKIYNGNEEFLESPYLASVYKGDVAVILTEQGALKTEESIYKVVSTIMNGTKKDEELNNLRNKEVRGELQIKGDRESLIYRMLRPAINVIMRESGF